MVGRSCKWTWNGKKDKNKNILKLNLYSIGGKVFRGGNFHPEPRKASVRSEGVKRKKAESFFFDARRPVIFYFRMHRMRFLSEGSREIIIFLYLFILFYLFIYYLSIPKFNLLLLWNLLLLRRSPFSSL